MSNVDEISSRLLKNSVVMLTARAASILTLLICVPAIVKFLGPEGYGVWESLLAVSGIALVFQTVISGMVLWRISMSFGTEDPAETRRLVRLGVGATLSLVTVSVPLICGLRFQIIDFLQIPQEYANQTVWLLPCVVAVALIGGINESLAAVITGYQRAGLVSLIQSLGLAISSLISICVLFLKGGLVSLLLGQIASIGITLAILYPVACSLCGRISLLPLLPTKRDITVSGPFVGLLLLSNLSLLFRDQTDKLVLASLVSPVAVGYFVMAQRLTAIIMQNCTALLGPFIAAVGMLQARGDWQGVQKLYLTVGTWSSMACGATTIVMCGLHKHLFVLWLGQYYPEATYFLAILLFGGTSAVLFSGAGSALCRGLGRSGPEAIYTTLALVLNLTLKYILIPAIGPEGTVFASAISWCCGSLLFLAMTHYLMALPRTMIARLLAAALVTLAIGAGSWWIEEQYPAPGGRLEAVLSITLISPLLIAGYLGTLIALRVVPLEEGLPLVHAVCRRLQGLYLRGSHA